MSITLLLSSKLHSDKMHPSSIELVLPIRLPLISKLSNQSLFAAPFNIIDKLESFNLLFAIEQCNNLLNLPLDGLDKIDANNALP